jgi:hypothetical protein
MNQNGILEQRIREQTELRDKTEQYFGTFFYLPPAKICEITKSIISDPEKVMKEIRVKPTDKPENVQNYAVQALSKAIDRAYDAREVGRAVELCECAREIAALVEDPRLKVNELVANNFINCAATCTVDLRDLLTRVLKPKTQ